MPKLNDFRTYHFEASVKVSDNTRTLSIAAIAIIWIFKTQSGDIYSVPSSLKLPLLFVTLALVFDFLQHVYRSMIWHYIYRSKERELAKEEITEDTELYVNSKVNWLAYFFYYAKVAALFIAYSQILMFFYSTVSWA